jgi:hypothetical protein
MRLTGPKLIRRQLRLADVLLARRPHMHDPQDLPGRYGRVVKAIDRLLQSIHAEAVLAGGWAVWHHGYVGRVTQDIDVVVAADRLDEFLRVAAVAGFDVFPQQPGRWPKMMHRDTKVDVDILPEGARPGMASKPAPTTIPNPSAMGAVGERLHYLRLESLVELKLAAGRPQDQADVVALIRANASRVKAVRDHLGGIHADYVAAFDRFVETAHELGPMTE